MRHKPTKPKYTYYWHIHHDTLCEGTYNIKERIAYIKKHKPKKEIPTRLRLMTPVLHPEKLPKKFSEVLDAFTKAQKIYIEAHDAFYADYIKARNASAKASIAIPKDACAKTYAAYIKAFKAYSKVQEACIEAFTTYATQLEELHKKEHPNCPWDGKTIFPK